MEVFFNLKIELIMLNINWSGVNYKHYYCTRACDHIFL